MPLSHRFVILSYALLPVYYYWLGWSIYTIIEQALVEFFGTLSREWALECMKDLLLVNLRGNLQIVVQVFATFSLTFPFLSLLTLVLIIIETCVISAGCQRIL
jgi:hypothetical protein